MESKSACSKNDGDDLGTETLSEPIESGGMTSQHSPNHIKMDKDNVEESEEVLQEKRRNHNGCERRRSKRINDGIDELRGLFECRHDPKLTKIAVLQKTVSYIQQLRTENSELVMRTAQLEKMVPGGKPDERPVFGREVLAASTTDHAVPIIKQEPGSGNRRKRKASTAQLDSVDGEGAASLYSEHNGRGQGLQSEVAELREETKRLRLTLENERLVRRNLEAQIRNLQLQNQTLTESVGLAQVQVDCKINNNIGSSTPRVIVKHETPRSQTVARNNFDSIFEAIRRVEGDHLFADDDDHNDLTPSPVEEVEISATDDVYITP